MLLLPSAAESSMLIHQITIVLIIILIVLCLVNQYIVTLAGVVNCKGKGKAHQMCVTIYNFLLLKISIRVHSHQI